MSDESEQAMEEAFQLAFSELGPLPDGQYRAHFVRAEITHHRGEKTLSLRYVLFDPGPRLGTHFFHHMTLARKNQLWMVKQVIKQLCPGEFFTMRTLVDQLNQVAGKRLVIFNLHTTGKYQAVELQGCLEAPIPHSLQIFYDWNGE